MEEYKSMESSKVCRTCLGTTGVLQSLFGARSNVPSLHLSDLITFCTSVDVILGDGLPELICTKCVITLVNMYNFKNQCINSDKILKEQLRTLTFLKQDFEIEEEEITIEIEPLEYQIDEKKITERESSKSKKRKGKQKQDDSAANESLNIISGQDQDTLNQKNFLLSNLQLTPKRVNVIRTQKQLKRQIDPKYLLKKHTIFPGFKKKELITKLNRIDIFKKPNIASAIQKKDRVKLTVKKKYPTRYARITQEQRTDCDKCDITFNKKEELWQHLAKDHKEINICEICGLKFRTLFLKKSHMRKRHFKDKQFFCKTCEEMFSTQEELDCHTEDVHSEAKTHVCEICFKGFDDKSVLKDHLKTHNGEKSFECTTCGQKFGYLGNLQRHMTRHSEVKAHVCSVCNKSFASKDELMSHLRAHTSRKSFVCSVCHEGFNTQSSLSKHELIHSGEQLQKESESRKMISQQLEQAESGEKAFKKVITHYNEPIE